MNGRRLIFYFYATPDYRENDAYKMHFSCLKKYSNVFDDAHFFISVDDITDKELISRVAGDIVSCGFVENVKFTIIENGQCCESMVFKNEIVDNLGELTGLTFFAHTKGVVSIKKYNRDSILKWIFGLYYMNLEFLEDVHNQLQVYQPSYQRFFYGTFLRQIAEEYGGGTNFGAEYEGTFFWINCVSLKNYMIKNEIAVPNEIGRFYAERFPGNIFPIGIRLGSKNYTYYVGDISLYDNCDEILSAILPTADLEIFNNEYKKIIKENGM